MKANQHHYVSSRI